MTQKQIIKTHLIKYGRITSFEAFSKYRIQRLAAIIQELEKDQFPVKSRLEFSPKDRSHHWSVYEVETVKCRKPWKQ